MSDLSVPAAADAFLITQEYRRFAEFCDACRQARYIGLCHGQPGVGKTLSARYYARWDRLEPVLMAQRLGTPVDLPDDLSECHTLYYTPTVMVTPRRLDDDIGHLRQHLRMAVGHVTHPDEAPLIRALRVPDQLTLLIVDEADRLKFPALEQLRDNYDRTGIGLVLIGMPGLEKRLARYAQFYSRVGFVHHFRPLNADALRLILVHQWAQLGLTLRPDDFSDAEAMAAIMRITGGNFRLIQRLFRQIDRILQINALQAVTAEVVDAARQSLVIGSA